MTHFTGQPRTLPAPIGDETGAVAAPARAAVTPSVFSDFSQLTKPRITAMVAITAWIGFEMGRRCVPSVEVASPWLSLLATVAGTSLSCMGASAYNQVIERRTDGLMHRTRHRPLPAGRATVPAVLALATALSLLGVTMLAVSVRPLAAVISAATILGYALIYTPLKRLSTVNTIVGAVPGALPPVIGYAASTGRVDARSLSMFAILFLWQLPHFLAIAWLYREDYARADLKMLPVIDTDGRATTRQILLGCLALLPLGLLPTMLGMSGMLYFTGALLCGLVFLASGVALERTRSRGHARLLFFISLLYVPAVFALMLLDKP